MPEEARSSWISKLERQRRGTILRPNILTLMYEGGRNEQDLPRLKREAVRWRPTSFGLVWLSIAQGALPSKGTIGYDRRPREPPLLGTGQLECEGALAMAVHVGLCSGSQTSKPKLRAAQHLSHVFVSGPQKAWERSHKLSQFSEQVLAAIPKALTFICALNAPIERRVFRCLCIHSTTVRNRLGPSVHIFEPDWVLLTASLSGVFHLHATRWESTRNGLASPILRPSLHVEASPCQAPSDDHWHAPSDVGCKLRPVTLTPRQGHPPWSQRKTITRGGQRAVVLNSPCSRNVQVHRRSSKAKTA
mmetsp:Transcript_106258/g.295643  ORF Transcript_106258/g.295643 Transcript_106258/m.295643 type:complete len:304 (-) Transcript_106258:10-921(-)